MRTRNSFKETSAALIATNVKNESLPGIHHELKPSILISMKRNAECYVYEKTKKKSTLEIKPSFTSHQYL